MPELRHSKRPPLTRWIIVTLIAVLVLSGAVYAVSTLFSDAYGRSQIDLVERFTTGNSDPDWPYLDAIDQTSEVCGSQVECIQAVGNEYLTLFKFESVRRAGEYAETLGADGVQLDPLVIYFNGAPLSKEIREEIVYTVSGINVSSPD